MKLSKIVDTLFGQRVALRFGGIVSGEQVPDPGGGPQVVIEAIVGTPEGRSLGSPGDLRVRLDVPQIWQKTSGVRTTTGWTQIGDGGSASGNFVENVVQMGTPFQVSDPNVAENTIIQYTVPGGSLAVGAGRVSAKLSGFLTNNANAGGTATLRVRYGGTEVGAQTIVDTDLAIGTYRYVLDISLADLVTTGIQTGFMLGQFQTPEGFIVDTGDWGVRSLSGALDSTVDQAFAVTVQLDASADMTWNTSYGHIELARA